MTKKSLLILMLPLVFGFSAPALSWGFFSHKLIAEQSINHLPPPLFAFFKQNIETYKDYSIFPDKRRYSDPNEAPKHYMNIDKYQSLGFEFMNLPYRFDEASQAISEATLKENGIVFWTIQKVYGNLIFAFKEKDLHKIIKLSGELCHYLSDAVVPLHMNSNYNGQKTNQVGIHGLWETKLPQRFHYAYSFAFRYDTLETPFLFLKTQMFTSFHLSHEVLGQEKLLTETLRVEQKFQARGKTKSYSDVFLDEYGKRMNPMIEERMNVAVRLTSDLIFRAWRRAEKPQMNTKNYIKSSNKRQKITLKTENLIGHIDK